MALLRIPYLARWLIALGVLQSSQFSVVSAAPCSAGWVESSVSGTCIKLYDEQKSWEDARAVCKAAGGDLVKIGDDSMNNFIWDQVKASKKVNYWIGLHDRNNEGKFEWLDEKTEAQYTNWQKGQPNNGYYPGHTTTEDCANIYNSNKWLDSNCKNNLRFICEKAKDEARAPAGTSCSDGWVESTVSGTCIKLHDEWKSWKDARAVCKAAGGDLVKIVDDKMNDFIGDLVTASGKRNYWIGLHDRNEEGKFEWLDEKAEAQFTNWESGQPNNVDSRGHFNGQDCVGMYKTKEWLDLDCDKLLSFICEKTKDSAPAPVLAASCPDGWVESTVSGTCIKLHDEWKSWKDARAVCKAAGGDLIKIVDTNMNDFIWSQVAASTKRDFWIGLHDQNSEGKFVWLDEKSEAQFTIWSSGQPNNLRSPGHYNGQDCVEIMKSKQWSDSDCDQEFRFICEKPKDGQSAADPASCPDGWIESRVSGTCIKLHDELKSWKDARGVCKAAGGDLVKISNESMNDFIWKQVAASNKYDYWIGLHDQNQEGKFEWLDEKTEAQYTNWEKGQPNNLDDNGHDNGQDCVEIYNSKEWFDSDCEKKYRFICEKEKGRASAQDLASCPDGWIESKGSGTCIKFYDVQKSWKDARAVCKAAGGDLVKIVDTNMNDFIGGQVAASKRVDFWIGLHDQNQEGKFEWLDEKTEAQYTNWKKGQPNNLDEHGHDNGQDCVEIYNSKEWFDSDCERKYSFICEKEKGRPSAQDSPVEAASTLASVTEHTTIRTTKQTSASTIKQTSAQTTKQTTAPTTKQMSASTTKQTSAPIIKQTTASTIRQTAAQIIKQTSAQTTKQTTAPTIRQTAAQIIKQTSAQSTKQTTAPTTKQMSASTTLHTSTPTTQQTSIPKTKQTLAPTTKQMSTSKSKQIPTTEQTSVTTSKSAQSPSNPRPQSQNTKSDEKPKSTTTETSVGKSKYQKDTQNNDRSSQELGLIAIIGIVLAAVVVCSAIVGAAFFGRRLYLARQKVYTESESKPGNGVQFTNQIYSSVQFTDVEDGPLGSYD